MNFCILGQARSSMYSLVRQKKRKFGERSEEGTVWARDLHYKCIHYSKNRNFMD